MRLGEALATCPSLVLVERDPAGSNTSGRRFSDGSRTTASRSSRSSPAASTSTRAGSSGSTAASRPALKRALAAVGASWDACAGAADRRFAALAAAAIARPGQALVVDDEPHQGVPRTAAADAASARREAARGARAPRGQEDRTACRATGQRRRRTIGAGRPARLEPGEGTRADDEGDALAAAGGRPRRAARVPRGGRQRADPSAGTGGTARPDPRPPRARRAGDPQGRALGATRRRWLVASHRDAPRAERGAGDTAGGARAEARRAPRARAQLSASSCSPLAESEGRQLALDPARRAKSSRPVSGTACARCARSAGAGAVATVVEVAPWSRIPEQRALLVPRD